MTFRDQNFRSTYTVDQGQMYISFGKVKQEKTLQLIINKRKQRLYNSNFNDGTEENNETEKDNIDYNKEDFRKEFNQEEISKNMSDSRDKQNYENENIDKKDIPQDWQTSTRNFNSVTGKRNKKEFSLLYDPDREPIFDLTVQPLFKSFPDGTLSLNVNTFGSVSQSQRPKGKSNFHRLVIPRESSAISTASKSNPDIDPESNEEMHSGKENLQNNNSENLTLSDSEQAPNYSLPNIDKVEIVNKNKMGIYESMPVSYVRTFDHFVIADPVKCDTKHFTKSMENNEKLNESYERSLGVPIGEILRIPNPNTQSDDENLGYVDPITFNEIWTAADLDFPKAHCALTFLVHKGVPKYVFPNLHTYINQGGKRWMNRGLNTVTLCPTWARFSDLYPFEDQFLHLEYSQKNGGSSNLILDAKPLVKQMMELIANPTPYISFAIEDGFHFFTVFSNHEISLNSTNFRSLSLSLVDSTMIDLPKSEEDLTSRNASPNDENDENISTVGDILVNGKSIIPQLNIMIREVSAGKDSYSLPDVYKDLFHSKE